MKWLRAFLLLGCAALSFSVWGPTSLSANEQLEVQATLAMTAAIAHLSWFAPHRPWSWQQLPGQLLSLAAIGWGALHFKPGDNFSPFFSAYCGLALSYGYFCCAVPKQHRLREQVIRPVKNFSKIGLPGFDLGIAFAPFLFPLMVLRFWLRSVAAKDRKS